MARCPNVQKLSLTTYDHARSYRTPPDHSDFAYDGLIPTQKLKEVRSPRPEKIEGRYKRRELAGVIRHLVEAGLKDLEKVMFARKAPWERSEYISITKMCKVTRDTAMRPKLWWGKLYQSHPYAYTYSHGKGNFTIVGLTEGEEDGADSQDDVDENESKYKVR